MYCPEAFVVSDPEQLQSFIEQYSFATLVNTIDGRPFATHLPFLLDSKTSAQGALLGHMARANPQWRTFEGGQEVLAIFQGPHSYISPSWYETDARCANLELCNGARVWRASHYRGHRAARDFG